MKKYLFILVSSSFLVAFDGANAAENRQVTEAARTMNTKPHWADFMADPAYDAVKGNRSLTHPAAIKEALEKAYDAWLAANPSLTAKSAADDREVRAKLATENRSKLLARMATADSDAAARDILKTNIKNSLLQNHKPALVKGMVAHNVADTARSVVFHHALETEIGKAIHNAHAAGGDAAVNAHVKRLLGTDQAGAADLSSADRAETRAAVIREMLRKDDFRTEVITALEAGHHAVGAERVAELVRGAHPGANDNGHGVSYGDGHWHTIFSTWGGQGNDNDNKGHVRDLIVNLDVGIGAGDLPN
jgi:hypothetical protein